MKIQKKIKQITNEKRKTKYWLRNLKTALFARVNFEKSFLLLHFIALNKFSKLVYEKIKFEHKKKYRKILEKIIIKNINIWRNLKKK